MNGTWVTTAVRTASDLARRPNLTEAVVALDALARNRFPPQAVLDVAATHPGERGLRRLRAAIVLCDPRAESPMEPRIRVAVHRYRLPAPELQHPLGPYRLDLPTRSSGSRSSTTVASTAPRSARSATSGARRT
ncbi:MAG: hypothetical protein K0R87_2557 [Pseudonocardia sp.]|nr:hypothetical protein [Pseudonocardia sp.]